MSKTQNRRRIFLGAAALLLAACSQEVPTDKIPEPAQQNQQELAPPRAEAAKPEAKRFRKGPHRGPAMLLRAALKELELRPEQTTTIEGLLSDLEASDPFASPAHRDFQKALAAGVRAGKLDAAALEPHYAAIEKNASEAGQKVHAALNKLHQTLDAEQRKALVASVERRMKDGPRGRGPHFGPPDPDDAPPMAGCDEPEAQCEHGPRGFRGHGGPGFGMLKDLDLSDAQKAKLRAAREQGMPERSAMQQEMQKKGEHMKQMLAAFATDRFDAGELGKSAPMARHARQGAEARVKHLETLLGVLEPAQRDKLAARVEAGPGWRKH